MATTKGDLQVLSRSWERSLNASDMAPATVRIYTIAVAQLAAFLEDRGMPLVVANLTREHIEEFLIEVKKPRQASTGKPLQASTGEVRSATAETRYRSLKQFFKWLVGDGELTVSPMERMKPPQIPERPVPLLPDVQQRALLKACQGKRFEDWRDYAIVRLFIDTGVRRSELAYVSLDQLDLDNNQVRVLGKFNRVRMVPFGKKTAAALDKYLRVRALHRHAADRALWLGRQGPMTDGAVDLMVRRRARQAGLSKTHAHLFRHGWAHVLKADGVSDGEIMSLGGWRSADMVRRYGQSADAELAIASYQRRTSPGDRL